jgi:hypothetical protein
MRSITGQQSLLHIKLCTKRAYLLGLCVGAPCSWNKRTGNCILTQNKVWFHQWSPHHCSVIRFQCPLLFLIHFPVIKLTCIQFVNCHPVYTVVRSWDCRMARDWRWNNETKDTEVAKTRSQKRNKRGTNGKTARHGSESFLENSPSASQDIHRLSWNKKFHNRVHKRWHWSLPHQSTPNHPPQISNIQFNRNFHQWLVPRYFRFQSKILYVFTITMRATCSGHLMLLDVTTLFINKYKSRSSSQCSFLLPPATSSQTREVRVQNAELTSESSQCRTGIQSYCGTRMYDSSSWKQLGNWSHLTRKHSDKIWMKRRSTHSVTEEVIREIFHARSVATQANEEKCNGWEK